jgi:hypothetical protein
MPRGNRAGKTRRRIVALAAVGLVAGLLGTSSASANLPGSTFESNDGNQVVDTTGNTDWINAPGSLEVGVDLPSGQNDNSFGQGAKNNDVNTTVVSGQIPNSKADIGRFAVASEKLASNGHTLMYLAWIRNNVSGTTNFDFEVNKLAQPDLTTPGPKVLNRSVGDLLISYDFQGGAQKPTLTLRLWTAAGEWGAPALLGSTVAEGEVARVSIANFLGGPTTVPAFQFGEAAIDLTAAGVLPDPNDPNASCVGFGSAYVKSRSSNAFTAELKDFVAPIPVHIRNCGTIIIKKVTVPSPDPTATSFPFTLTGGPSALNKSFSLVDGGSNTTTDVKAGNGYVAAETVPANWVLTSATCDDGSPVTNIDVSVDETVTCTFTNTLQRGAITVTKTRKHAAEGSGDHPFAGVNFTVNGVTKATDAQGQACFDGLLFGSYVVHETTPPGYATVADQTVTVDNTATCAGGGGESVSFSNTPLTNLTVSVDSQVDGGTASTIDCVLDSAATGPNGDGSLTLPDLEPGTYTCTVVIDP